MSAHPIIAGMATYDHPERKKAVLNAVASIIAQVDALHIYCNNYHEADVPEMWRADPKIQVSLSDEHMGDLTDLGKFYPLTRQDVHGYYLTLDDDILYPPTYVDDAMRALIAYDCACIITYHGAILRDRPVQSFYNDRRVYHNQSMISSDISVHVGSTACMAFHTETFRFIPAAKMTPCMADIHVAIAAQHAKIPTVCVAHQRNLFQFHALSDTIYNRFSSPGMDKIQTAAVNAHRWVLYPLPPKLKE